MAFESYSTEKEKDTDMSRLSHLASRPIQYSERREQNIVEWFRWEIEPGEKLRERDRKLRIQELVSFLVNLTSLDKS